jgi:hypothetical protein
MRRSSMSDRTGNDVTTPQASTVIDVVTSGTPAPNRRAADTASTPSTPEDPRLIPEVVEIRLDYTKDAVQMGKGGCRRWK